jgi:aconitate hydratase
MTLSNADFLRSFGTNIAPAHTAATHSLYSLPLLEEKGWGAIKKLPVSIRIVLESLLRNWDGTRVSEEHVRALSSWQPNGARQEEIPFVVARVLLQDLTGVPLGVDLAAMRSAVERLGKNPAMIEPLVPVDLVVDHSVQVDFSSQADAYLKNLSMEFGRNQERYQFLKWCMESFKSFRVIPPGIGICHQVNLEYLGQGVLTSGSVVYPDTLVGTDSHTTMINGLGTVGWGVGGIEAEAAMLGQPVYMLTPDVVGVHVSGRLREGVTATDLVLHVTEMLRKAKVVGKFVEFHGEGARSLSVPDRATIANMAPEYGATMGFFPIDERTCEYLLATGRTPETVALVRAYYEAQGMFGIPLAGECAYTTVIELDLATVNPSVAGPKRPQDRIDLSAVVTRFREAFHKPVAESGFGKNAEDLTVRHSVPEHSETLGHGDILIAAITSCTNTSNPSVMLAAGLLAKKAVEKGLKRAPFVKASLAPGSRVVTEYLEKTGLQPHLDALGFNLVGYGCTTCIGNSGPLDPAIESVIQKNDLVTVSALSGNRNFEARVHQHIKANFLVSPPLVVAYAIAGSILTDLTNDPIGTSTSGEAVYLRDIWPSSEEIEALMQSAMDPATYQRLYTGFENQNPLWQEVPAPHGSLYAWDTDSTYIQEPPYFDHFSTTPSPVRNISGARILLMVGDSVTTDHISPAGSIKPSSAAGTYLINKGVSRENFNSYGARRGNHEVMVRGTFANVRIKNKIIPGSEGPVTRHFPTNDELSIYDASLRYQTDGVPLVVFAGQEYGTGSSRDWAAKGTRLLGVKAVIAQSFERIHRSNLIGMGVLPCQFIEGQSAETLGIKGDEKISLSGIEGDSLAPRKELQLSITRADDSMIYTTVILRIDTPIEVEYYRSGGILPYVLGELLKTA